MQTSSQPEQKKSFFHNDLALVGSLLALYGICFLSLGASIFFNVHEYRQSQSLQATSTASAAATAQARATATTVARSTEQAQYEILDSFDDNSRYWNTESIDDEYMNGAISVSAGLYVWNIREVKQPFVYWSNVRTANWLKDFDLYVDSKIVEGAPGNACTGFAFRTRSSDWEEGAYTFSVCNDSSFDINYYKQGTWEGLANRIYTGTIQNEDWNRLEINARGDHFTFRINNEVVYELSDDRIEAGGLALIVEIDGSNPVTLWFDNFGLQRR